jgi:hypothetical protein
MIRHNLHGSLEEDDDRERHPQLLLPLHRGLVRYLLKCQGCFLLPFLLLLVQVRDLRLMLCYQRGHFLVIKLLLLCAAALGPSLFLGALYGRLPQALPPLSRRVASELRGVRVPQNDCLPSPKLIVRVRVNEQVAPQNRRRLLIFDLTGIPVLLQADSLRHRIPYCLDWECAGARRLAIPKLILLVTLETLQGNVNVGDGCNNVVELASDTPFQECPITVGHV